jgi:hypothetical protein
MAQNPTPVSDDPDAPLLYVDEITAGGVLNGNFNFTFSAVQYDHGKSPPAPYRRTKLRLVIPIPALVAGQQLVNDLIARATRTSSSSTTTPATTPSH